MKSLLISIAVTAALALPQMAAAQKTNQPSQPGHSESAPGQKALKPGEARQYAPGQMEQRKDKDNKPGAKEYAPGHQPNK
jgi:hypothetical protein